MTIIIKEDKEFRAKFEAAAIKLYEENNIKRGSDPFHHIGDGTYCARKALIPYIFPSRAGLDIYEVGNFMRGLGVEHATVVVLDYMNKLNKTNFQLDIIFDDITGHPDYVVDGQHVFEIKSTNAQDDLDINSSNLKSYTRQVVYYMLLTGISKGKVIINYGLPFRMKYDKESKQYDVYYRNKEKRSPYFMYSLEITEDEPLRKTIRTILIDKIKPTFDKAVKNRDLTIIPVLEERKKYDWKCMSCKFRKLCDMVPDKQEDQELRGYLLNKHIDNIVQIQEELD
jgi:hypothetical protein